MNEIWQHQAMTAARTITPQRYDRLVPGAFLRTRRGDADWDFFPFGHREPGFRVDGLRREVLFRVRRWCGFGQFVAFMAALLFWHMFSEQGIAGASVLAIAVIVPIGLPYLCLWMTVRFLPPAETSLESDELMRWDASTSSAVSIVVTGFVGAALVLVGATLVVLAVRDDKPGLATIGVLLTVLAAPRVWHWIRVGKLRTDKRAPRVFD